MADERWRGIDEMSEKIGEVRAGQVALNQRLDGLALERQQQHVEAIKLLTDTAAQYHEIKHELENVGTKFNAIGLKLDHFGATLQRHVEDDGKQFAKHEAAMRDSAAALGKEVLTNRETLIARLDDLSAWRNRMRGAKAVISALVGGMLVVFGHDILEFGKGLFHWGGK